MTIKVSGKAKLVTDFVVELDMTEDDFRAMEHKKQIQLVKRQTDWHNVNTSGEVEIVHYTDVVKVVE